MSYANDLLHNYHYPEPPMTKVTGFLLHRILHTKICLTNSPQAIPVVPTVLTYVIYFELLLVLILLLIYLYLHLYLYREFHYN